MSVPALSEARLDLCAQRSLVDSLHAQGDRGAARFEERRERTFADRVALLAHVLGD